MKVPSKKVIFSALYFGLSMFLLDHFLIGTTSAGSGRAPWFWNLAIWLVAGAFVAWSTERSETYIERKNARWKARKEAEKE
ncbi:hypothetical protein [Neolewinella agarilytica]|uniref:hypothetical protein n=1 Tax=Neolewinella agarilytica TaxID=478744 RepID=UPI0023525049|nr:hypothetical protein [Neolewinella agarilytica]